MHNIQLGIVTVYFFFKQVLLMISSVPQTVPMWGTGWSSTMKMLGLPCPVLLKDTTQQTLEYSVEQGQWHIYTIVENNNSAYQGYCLIIVQLAIKYVTE